jgi:hypothetical protein
MLKPSRMYNTIRKSNTDMVEYDNVGNVGNVGTESLLKTQAKVFYSKTPSPAHRFSA